MSGLTARAAPHISRIEPRRALGMAVTDIARLRTGKRWLGLERFDGARFRASLIVVSLE